jgi:hypothetical protein
LLPGLLLLRREGGRRHGSWGLVAESRVPGLSPG